MGDDDEGDNIELFQSIIALLAWKRKDELCDKFSNKFTTLILFNFAAVVTVYQFINPPIVCWCPAHFTDSHVSYANSYCWVKNTYYIPYERPIPKAEEARDYIRYYQWTAFILLIQAALFTLPSLMWHNFNNRGVVDTDDIIQLAGDSGGIDKAPQIANMIHQLVKTRNHGETKQYNACRRAIYYVSHLCGEKVPGFLLFLFFFTKLMYIANAIGQFFLLDYFLFNQFSSYGFEVMGGVASDHDWQDAPFDAFPRVTMCDFNVRRLGNVQRYTVQCNLPLNRINEKVYMFLWFWMALVAAISILGLVQWLLYICIPGDGTRFVSNHLHFTKNDNTAVTIRDPDEISEFTRHYLKVDGVFVLRLIAHHSNHIITTEVTGHLWEMWQTKYKKSNHV